MRQHGYNILLCSLLLAACGGGGGSTGSSTGNFGTTTDQTLFISISYPDSIPLFHSGTVQPQLGGFNGRTPRCALTGGTLPPGMTLRADCSLEGRALAAGLFAFDLRVSASGSGNSIETTRSVRVAGPTVYYTDRSFSQAPMVGERIRDVPNMANWTIPPDISVAWSYRLMNGRLPSGMSLDGSSGIISGAPLEPGAFQPTIQSAMTTSFGTFEPVVTTYHLNVEVPYVGYGESASTGGNVAYISQPVSLAPGLIGRTSDSAVISSPSFSPALPPGLSADPATGAISGVPTTRTANMVFYDLRATLTAAGVSVPTQGTFVLSVRPPVEFSYGLGLHVARIGVPYVLAPTVTQVSPIALTPSSTVNYAVRTGEELPPGLSLDAATGTLSGTPTVAGTTNTLIDATYTNNGVTWSTGGQFYVQVQ